MGELSPWHLLIIAIVFVVLFGAKKLPDAARSVGRSMRIFKAEIKSMSDDEDQPAQQSAQAREALPPAPPAPAAAAPAAEPTRTETS